MGVLNEIGLKYDTDKSSRAHGYLDFYEANLPNRDFDGRLLEIGIMDGNSLRMWKEYYPKAEIVGIDILVRPKEIEGVYLFEMNSSDITSLLTLGYFDIICDDGSHMTLDQQISFYWLFSHQLNEGGIYILEDLHTSFMKNYINTPVTTYDLLKDFYGVKEYNENNGRSISFIIEKEY